MDFAKLFTEFGRAIAWSLVAAVSMGISLGIAVRVYDLLTPGIEEMEELRKGNMAVAVVLAAVILSFGFVLGCVLHGPM